MSGYKPERKAPSDKEAERVYEEIMKRAELAGLIVQAYGGVATIAIPVEQRKAGIRERVLRAGLFELEDEATRRKTK